MAEACTHLHPTQQLVLLLRRPESASGWRKRSAASCTRCAARWGCLWGLHAAVAPMQRFTRVLVHGTCLRCGCVHWPAISPRILVQAGRLGGEAQGLLAQAHLSLSPALTQLRIQLLSSGGAPGGGGAGAAGAGQPGQAAAGPGADAEGALRAGTYSARVVCSRCPAGQSAVPCWVVVERRRARFWRRTLALSR